MATEVRFPLVANLQIEDFVGPSITKASAKLVNAIADKNVTGTNERVFITQRPAFNMKEDASDYVADTQGRGIYYWDDSGALYIVNNNKLYKNSQANVAIATISAGSSSIIFKEIGIYLVLIDAENDEAWTITTADVVTKITHASFPSTISGGGVFLDQYLFLMDDDGSIYNSSPNDPTTWNSIDVISSERDTDKGVYLAKHHDHVVSFGHRTIEFFYDAGNPVASPLKRRQDKFYNIGCVNKDSVWEIGEVVFFLGINARGGVGVYKLENFELSLISTDGMGSYLTEIFTRDNVSSIASGIYAHGHTFYILSLHYINGSSITVEESIVYDNRSDLWHIWNTDLSELSSQSGIPLISWTVRTSDIPRIGEGILVTGDIVEVLDNMVPVDLAGTAPYVVDDYVEVGYIETKERSGTNINLVSRIGKIDNDSGNTKFMRGIELDGDYTITDQTATIRWTDGADPETMTNSRSIATHRNSRISRLGSYKRRTMEFAYSGDEQIRISSLICDIDEGR